MSDATDQLALAMMNLRELLVPAVEACEGYRDDMVKRGWSAPAAEQVAAELLLNSVRLVVRLAIPS